MGSIIINKIWLLICHWACLRFCMVPKSIIHQPFSKKIVVCIFHTASAVFCLCIFNQYKSDTHIHMHDWYGMKWCQISILFNFQGVPRSHERTLLNGFLKHFIHLSIFNCLCLWISDEKWSVSTNHARFFCLRECTKLSTSMGSQVLLTRISARWKPN